MEHRIAFARAEGDLHAAVVVEVGCYVPDGVVVSAAPEGYAIAAGKITEPTPECSAPVTPVAVVAIRD